MTEKGEGEGGTEQRTDSRDVARALALKSQREHHLEVLEAKLEEATGEGERRQAGAEFATWWAETLFWIWELHLDNPEVPGEGLKEEMVRTHDQAAGLVPSAQEGASSSERRLAGLGWGEVEQAMAAFRDNLELRRYGGQIFTTLPHLLSLYTPHSLPGSYSPTPSAAVSGCRRLL